MPKKHHNQFVRCLENIQDLSGMGLYEYALIIGGLANSMKTIRYNAKTDKYSILNHIDDTRQTLTAKQMLDKRYTNIGEGMKKRCLIALID